MHLSNIVAVQNKTIMASSSHFAQPFCKVVFLIYYCFHISGLNCSFRIYALTPSLMNWRCFFIFTFFFLSLPILFARSKSANYFVQMVLNIIEVIHNNMHVNAAMLEERIAKILQNKTFYWLLIWTHKEGNVKWNWFLMRIPSEIVLG